MAKRARQQRTKRMQSVDNRSVEFLTVGWMLMVVTTLVCEIGAAACHLYVVQINRQATTVEVLSRLLLFGSFVVGCLSLVVCSVVVKSRREVPPRSILIFAIVVGVAPLVTVLLQAIQ
jgi:uncharacterized membrane protein